jgi:hypothetical protein
VDQQVKIRGYRVELGEIEARLEEYEGIKQAVVVVREGEKGEKRLAAYYTSPGESGAEAESIRGHLLARLPEWMVPAAYVRLEVLPLTANGKVDRKVLPEPETGAYVQHGYEAPQNELESRLAGLWVELLGVERIGRHDNFFELGGHSLLALKLLGRMRQQGLEAEVRGLFTSPTLAGFAATVGGQRRKVEVPVNRIPGQWKTSDDSSKTLELRI